MFFLLNITRSAHSHVLLKQNKLNPRVFFSSLLENQENYNVESQHVNQIRSNWKLRGGNFSDFRRITVKGGAGGNGCVSFAKEIHLPQGPPNGGNGGSGGNVYFIADINESSLAKISSNVTAESGKNGKGKDLHGHKGKDLFITVPVGTVVREIQKPVYDFLELYDLDEKFDKKTVAQRNSDNNQPEFLSQYEEIKKYHNEESGKQRFQTKSKNKSALDLLYEQTELERKLKNGLSDMYSFYPSKDIHEESFDLKNLPHEYVDYLFKLKNQIPIEYDLNTHGQQALVCMGGTGGNGNPFFASLPSKSTYIALKGLAGQKRILELELKSVADVGLVGMPNAGKSTFIGAVSNAHPRIAPYPFTTLNPYIGTVDLDKSNQITIADIPGIIKGAHMNKGLGHSFLRHVERSKVLAYVIDLSKPNPWDDLAILQSELELYDKSITKKPALVIANKADLHDTAKSNYETWIKFSTIPIVPVSSKEVKNVKKIIRILEKLVNSTK
ncbi:hypothetical protein BB561_006110 [Smittium simulii]|uniref:OBG-type G domain-containing protein n=1 Tax=Smittium simulii TaxID=133385 RepID=A0A2T9Y6I5_9FUNG|nr:hypothetical protein BB561_006110 [Smittium simulii]